MPDKAQTFRDNLDKKLWNAADKLRSALDPAQYKHAVLGLLFVRYVSDAFDIRGQELTGLSDSATKDLRPAYMGETDGIR